MKKLSSIVLVGASVFAVAGQGAPPQIKSVHDQFSAAMTKGDIAGAQAVIKANFSPDFIRTDKNVRETRAQFIANMKLPAGMKVKKFQFILGKYSASGTTSTGMVQTVVDATMIDPQTKKVHALHAVSSEKEVWKKVGNRWMMSTITALSRKGTMDGKPFDMGG